MRNELKLRNLNIKSTSDVILLYESIHDYGCFTQKDYDKCMSSVRCLNVESDDLAWFLEQKIKPLIGFKPLKISKTTGLECRHYELYSTTNKASDFQFEQGCIRLEDLTLTSARIDMTPFDVLAQIEGDFFIAPDSDNPKSFHFVPYRDLSRLLGSIAKIQNKSVERRKQFIRAYEKKEEQRQLSAFLLELDQLINCFFSGDYFCCTLNGSADSSYRKLYDTLRQVHAVPPEMSLEEFSRHMYPRAYEVPITDVEVEDFKITLSTTHIQPLYEHSWISFLEFLERKSHYSSKLDKWEKLIRKRYRKKEAQIELILKDTKTITVHTLLTQRSFREAFVWKRPIKGVSVSGRKWETPTRFIFPAEYLTAEPHYDYSLYEYFDRDKLVDLITSHPFFFPNSYYRNFKTFHVAKIFQIDCQEEDTFIADNYGYRDRKSYIMVNDRKSEMNKDLRCSKPVHAPFLGMPIYEEECVIHFKENFNHLSDIDSWGCTKHGKTLLKYSRNGRWLTMIPAESNYATYHFTINPEMIDINYAAFILVKCFSSAFDNKRERFRLTEELRTLGFTYFSKA